MQIDLYLVERLLTRDGKVVMTVLVESTTNKTEARRVLAADVEHMLLPSKQAALQRVGAGVRHRMTATPIHLRHGYS